jgi:hypothetical protein
MKILLPVLLLAPGSGPVAQELKIATIAPDGSSWMNELLIQGLAEAGIIVPGLSLGEVCTALQTGATIGLDQRAMARLSSADRDHVLTVFVATLERVKRGSREDNLSALDAIERQGIVVKSPGREQSEAWQELANRTRREMIESGQVRVPHLDRLEKALERVRD